MSNILHIEKMFMHAHTSWQVINTIHYQSAVESSSDLSTWRIAGSPVGSRGTKDLCRYWNIPLKSFPRELLFYSKAFVAAVIVFPLIVWLFVISSSPLCTYCSVVYFVFWKWKKQNGDNTVRSFFSFLIFPVPQTLLSVSNHVKEPRHLNISWTFGFKVKSRTWDEILKPKNISPVLFTGLISTSFCLILNGTSRAVFSGANRLSAFCINPPVTDESESYKLPVQIQQHVNETQLRLQQWELVWQQ